MADQQFVTYVKQQLAAGISREAITQTLKLNGLSEQDIAAIFAEAQAGSATPMSAPQAIPQAVPVSAVPQTIAPQVAAPANTSPRPKSVLYFEIFMYTSVVVSVLGPWVMYMSITQRFNDLLGPMVFGSLFALPVLIAKLVLIFLAARRRMNWARIVLIAVFLFGLLSSVAAVSALLARSLTGFVSIVPVVLQIVAFCFVFSRSANSWFGTDSVPGGVPLQGGAQNTTWTKVIPRINLACLILPAPVLFVLYPIILMGEPELTPFWIIMLVVFGIFGVFYYLENRVFRKKYSHSASKKDTWIAVLIVLRNIVFILNYIPFIQLLGLAGLAFMGIPFIVIYGLLLQYRSREPAQPN